MNISKEKPAIYDKCREHFGVEWDRGIVITYGDTVYCKFDLTDDLIVHEATHVKQQTEMDKDLWWDRYVTDKEFRLSQELEAYLNQLYFINNTKSRDYRRAMRKRIIHDMSTLYGGMCTAKEADILLEQVNNI